MGRREPTVQIDPSVLESRGRIEYGIGRPRRMASLLVQSMCAVGVLGEQSGIDPGRPGVADFGRKLYGMGPPDPWKS